ncbi:hypothetical protein BH10PSE17_BH10PSE17_21710 [soil metagenome]
MNAASIAKIAGIAGCAVLALSACSTPINMGDASAKTAVTGSAGGASTSNANSALEHCSDTLGTLAVVEDQNGAWYTRLRSYKLDSTVPMLRLMIQQSNCFVVVERGRALANMQQERALMNSGEMRAGSNMGAGQMVAADFTMSPSITFADQTGGGGASLGSFLGKYSGFASLAGNMSSNEASTMLTMIDNRSGVQLAAAEGSAKNMDFGLFSSFWDSGTTGSLGGYSKTPEGKTLAAAFMDSFNQLVRATRTYKAQTVQGGLGTGGRLGVDGGTTPASQKLNQPASSSTTTKKPATTPAKPVAKPATAPQ